MKLLVVDGNSIINRAFYGIRALTNSKGVFTNGVFGFLSSLFRTLEEENPEGICVAFDLPAPTFRHRDYAAYKAQRKGMPDELASQMPLLQEVLEAMHIPCLSLAGYEADDIIGTIACRFGVAGNEVIILTGDKDDLQLCSDYTRVKLTVTKQGRPEVTDFTTEKFEEVYGFPPIQLIDLKGLMGDSSDNIPGVPGIGEKTALELVRTYGTVEQLYAALDTLPLKAGVLKKLREGEERAELSKRLATICTAVPLEMEQEDFKRVPWDEEKLYELFQNLEFQTFLKKFDLKPPLEAQEQSQMENSCDGESALRALAAASEVYLVLDEEGLSLFLDKAYLFAGESESYGALLEQLAAFEGRLILHDGKKTMTILGKELSNIAFDTYLAGYLLSASADNYTTETLSCKLLQTSGLPKGEAVRRLYPVMLEKLRENGMEALLTEMELPLAAVLFRMEQIGFRVDREALSSFGERLDETIARTAAQIFAHAGCTFNIQSPKQLGKILFEDLGLPVVKKSKTGYATNADVLEKLRSYHPIIDLITTYRTMTKLKSTYVEGLLKEISPKDGRIHTTFQQTVTATGRISSTEPNLQNIPVRDEPGRELRRMFVPREGWVLVDADYSQIELRVLAHMAGDATMTEAFRTGTDIHTLTACQVFGVAPEEVTPLLRRKAKAVNFGIVYGIGEFSLSQDIGATVKEAKAYIQSYFDRYPAIKTYFDQTVADAKANGFVTTMFGRRRELPELAAQNFNIRSFGERVAMNTPIQGSAADIIKIAMVRVDERLRREKLEARLILQVHDELILEAPPREREQAAGILQEEMEHAVAMETPLLAEVKVGQTWYETK